jgi:hypothetical protein
MEAKVFTSGNLGNDAKVINFENGKSVITFSIATNSYYTNADGEQVQKTTWHDCKKFVRQNVMNSLLKSSSRAPKSPSLAHSATMSMTKKSPRPNLSGSKRLISM